MEARKKITFDFIKENYSITQGKLLIAEVNGRKYIGRLCSINANIFNLDDVCSIDNLSKESYSYRTFYESSADIFLPTSADIENLGTEMLVAQRYIINDSVVKPNKAFLKKINKIIDEQEKQEKLVKKFNAFCSENNIDEQDIWAYLNEKSEEEGW